MLSVSAGGDVGRQLLSTEADAKRLWAQGTTVDHRKEEGEFNWKLQSDWQNKWQSAEVKIV